MLDLLVTELAAEPGSNGYYQARCPAHDDRRASLSLWTGSKGDNDVALKCHAGCGWGSLWRSFRRYPEEPDLREATAYDYVDERGTLLYQTVRYDPKTFRPWRREAGAWHVGIKGTRHVLYRLPELRAAANVPIFIVEGEKDADNLAALGLVATTNQGGASAKWIPDYTDELRDRDAVLVPDRDEAGRRHVAVVAHALLGTARSVRVVELPGDGVKDASDWIEAGGDRTALLQLVETAPEAAEWLKVNAPATNPGTAEPDNWTEDPEARAEGARRDNLLASQAGRLRSRGLSEVKLPARLQAINTERCDPPLDDAAVRRISAAVSRYPARYTLDEVGNAERLRTRNGFEIRWTEGKKWLAYDGQQWSTERGPGMVRRRIHAMTRDMSDDAGRLDDSAQAKVLFNWARTSRSTAKVRGTEEQLARLKGIEARDDEFDADPWALNLLNGTLDLRTAELREHSQADLITKQVPARWDPTAQSDRLDRFLRETFGGDEELLRYLQKLAGHSLSGDASLEKIYFCYGPTASGKSTFLDMLRRTMGTYAMAMEFKAYMEGKFINPEAPSPNLVRLKGHRASFSVETGEHKRLDSGKLKQLSGGDPIAARGLYVPPGEFYSKAKIWLGSDTRPKLPDDPATKRRFVVIPFPHSRPKELRDPKVKAELTDTRQSGAAVLRWMVDGFLSWQREGLGSEPGAIARETTEYFLDMDPYREWAEASCDVRQPRQTELFSNLYASVSLWHTEQRRQPPSKKAFAKWLTDHGYPDVEGVRNSEKQRAGIRLTEEAREAVARVLDQRPHGARSGVPRTEDGE